MHGETIKIKCIVINCTCVLMYIAVRNAKYVFSWQQKWRGRERVHIVAAQPESWGPSHCASVTEHVHERLFVKLVLNRLIALTDIWGVLVNI